VGHWHLHRQDGLAIVSKVDQLRVLQQERKAWPFADQILMPALWLRANWQRPVWELAEECRVTPEFADRCRRT